MNATTKTKIRKWGQLVGLAALGVIAFLLMKRSAAEPKRRPPDDQGRAVRVIEAASFEVVPRTVGYGIVKAQREWEMVSQVSGRIIEMSDELKDGAFIKAGTKLLRVDPEDYQLAAHQQQAGVESVHAQIAELDAKEESTKANLKIEERSLELAKRDLKRSRELFESGGATQAELDTAERQVLTQEKAVQSLRNTLREIPASRRVYRAQSRQSQAGLAGAKLDVTRTEITAPFDIRVREVNVAPREVVGANQVLAVADGMGVAEVKAQLPLGAMRPLLPFRPKSTTLEAKDLAKLPEMARIQATIRLASAEASVQWSARLDRFSTVDSQTRTMGVVVAVDEPYKLDKDGPRRPPLVSGLYVEVELRGEPRAGCMAIPRSALHGDKVHLVGAESRLEIRQVTVDFSQAELACVKEGLKEGEQLVLTDLVPAIEGTLLAPQVDEQATQALRDASQGKGPVK